MQKIKCLPVSCHLKCLYGHISTGFVNFLLQWNSFMDGEGRVVDPKALKKRIFHGGLEPSLRPQVAITYCFGVFMGILRIRTNRACDKTFFCSKHFASGLF